MKTTKVEYCVKSDDFESAYWDDSIEAIGIASEWRRGGQANVRLIRRETETAVKEDVVG